MSWLWRTVAYISERMTHFIFHFIPQLFWIPDPFRDIGHCLSKPAHFFDSPFISCCRVAFTTKKLFILSQSKTIITVFIVMQNPSDSEQNLINIWMRINWIISQLENWFGCSTTDCMFLMMVLDLLVQFIKPPSCSWPLWLV